MAINPDKALVLSNKLKMEAAAIEALEKKIDAYLIANYTGRGSVSFSDLKHVNKFTIDEIVNKYRAEGWSVSYHSNQCDGGWLNFHTMIM